VGKCSVCGAKAVIRIPYARINLCEKHFVEYYERRIERTIVRYGLISKGMRIVVAISGGKDSASLAYVLSKIADKYDLKLLILHIDLGINNYSTKAREVVEEFSKLIKVPAAIISVKDVLSLGIPELAKLSRRPTCSVCGLVKRYIMNAFAIEVRADAVCTGHNMDDIMVNILKEFLNQNFEGMVKLVPKTLSQNGIAVGRIRPLYETTEREDLAYALINNLPFLKVTCPYMNIGGIDTDLKRYLHHLDSKYSGIRISFIRRFVSNVEKYWKHIANEGEVNKCKYCGLISQGDTCSFCNLTKRVLGEPAGPKVREYIRSYLRDHMLSYLNDDLGSD